MQEQASLAGGFAEPVFGAQRAFRAVMDALSRPGRITPLEPPPKAPAGLAPELAALALTLCDHDTRLWLDPRLAGTELVLAWLRFHCAAPLTADAAEAHFALVSAPEALPALAAFAAGTQEYPDRSTTIVLALPALEGGDALALRGPGIEGRQVIAPVGLPPDFVAQWTDNGALFPRGVDLLLVAPGAVIGLPRTTRIDREAL